MNSQYINIRHATKQLELVPIPKCYRTLPDKSRKGTILEQISTVLS